MSNKEQMMQQSNVQYPMPVIAPSYEEAMGLPPQPVIMQPHTQAGYPHPGYPHPGNPPPGFNPQLIQPIRPIQPQSKQMI